MRLLSASCKWRTNSKKFSNSAMGWEELLRRREDVNGTWELVYPAINAASTSELVRAAKGQAACTASDAVIVTERRPKPDAYAASSITPTREGLYQSGESERRSSGRKTPGFCRRPSLVTPRRLQIPSEATGNFWGGICLPRKLAKARKSRKEMVGVLGKFNLRRYYLGDLGGSSPRPG
jgi:hypothetical protein